MIPTYYTKIVPSWQHLENTSSENSLNMNLSHLGKEIYYVQICFITDIKLSLPSFRFLKIENDLLYNFLL